MKKKTLVASLVSGLVIIVTACQIQQDPEPIDEKTQFKMNFIGEYTVNNTAVISNNTYILDFSKSTTVITFSEDPYAPLLFNILTEGSNNGNTLDSICFDEGELFGSRRQILRIHSTTNATIDNVFFIPAQDQGAPLYITNAEILIDTNTGILYFDGVNIASKGDAPAPAPPGPPAPPVDIEAEFKNNVHGSYTANTTSLLIASGLQMDFAHNTIRISSSFYPGCPIYFNVSINGAQTNSTLYQIRYHEGTTNSGHIPDIHIISTNEAILSNVSLTPTSGNGSTIYNAVGQLKIIPSTGQLFYDGYEIGIKNP